MLPKLRRTWLIVLAVAIGTQTGCAAVGDEPSDVESTTNDGRDPADLIGLKSQAVMNGHPAEAQSLAQGYVRLWGWFATEGVFKPYCSGSLLTGTMLITATHCQTGSANNPVFAVGQIVAQVGNQAFFVKGMAPMQSNLDQTIMEVDGSFGTFRRRGIVFDGNKSKGAQVKCVGRGALFPDGSRDRNAPQTYTVVTVEGGADLHPVFGNPRSFNASFNNRDQFVTHGDSGGGCFLIQLGVPESAWPLIGVVRGSTGSGGIMNATTFANSL